MVHIEALNVDGHTLNHSTINPIHPFLYPMAYVIKWAHVIKCIGLKIQHFDLPNYYWSPSGPCGPAWPLMRCSGIIAKLVSWTLITRRVYSDFVKKETLLNIVLKVLKFKNEISRMLFFFFCEQSKWEIFLIRTTDCTSLDFSFSILSDNLLVDLLQYTKLIFIIFFANPLMSSTKLEMWTGDVSH